MARRSKQTTNQIRGARAACAALAALLASPLLAQVPWRVEAGPEPDAWALPMDRGAAGLWQTLLKLHTRASLLMITAHPDDEDGGMLSYESRGQGARVAMLTLNRGEGGQNVMSDDYWDALGLVRTEELLGAGRYAGINQYFTSVADFGFSKTKEEALAQWGKERVLADVVRVVREVRPLVLTSVFVGGPSDGHGHHQVAGEMTQEVYLAAGDPNAFPDQIKAGLMPWKPLKVYARVPAYAVSDKGLFDYATGKYLPVRFFDYVNQRWIEGPLTTTLEVPEGDYDPLLGASFVQVAREGLGLQKSQNGGGSIPAAGPFDVPYHRFGARVAAADQERSFFDDVDVSLAGIADLAPGAEGAFLKPALKSLNELVEAAMSRFSAADPGRVAPTLAEGLKGTEALIHEVESSGLSEQARYDVLHELGVKRVQFTTALAQSLGLSLEATVAKRQRGPGRGMLGGFGGPAETFEFAIPGQAFDVKVHVANQGAATVEVEGFGLHAPDGERWSIEAEGPGQGELLGKRAREAWFTVKVPEDAASTRPYFTRPDLEQPYYDVLDARDRGLPLAPYPLSAYVDVRYAGASVRLAEVVQVVRRVTGQGTVLDPLLVAPAISVRIDPSAGIVPLGEKQFPLDVDVRSEVEGKARGSVRLKLPEGWTASPASAAFSTEREGEERSLRFTVTPARLEQKPYTLTAVAESGGRSYSSGFVVTGYPGLRPYPLYEPASYRTRGVDVKVAPGLSVAYVTGTGDDVPKSLENLGIKVHFLSAEDLASGDLARYDAILLGIRAYAARPELKAVNARLLDYVKGGGVVVVQYNTSQYDHDYGPYHYSLPNDAEKVVDETAPVSVVDPKSAVLTWPNAIGGHDFDGWVEERGHGFMKTWDARYEAPLETHDPGQDPQQGGLLFARYGHGAYVYAAFALYRQLPEGVPGAYRLLANLISLKKNPRLAAAGGPAPAGGR
jgi:LmbE family N-acetylglucosaminyl deacetylase